MNILELTKYDQPDERSKVTRRVYQPDGQGVTISEKPRRYISKYQTYPHLKTDDQREFHSLLIKLTEINGGEIPIALQQRYGLDPLLTYCRPYNLRYDQILRDENPEEYDANLREAMHNAVALLIRERQNETSHAIATMLDAA